MNPCTRCNGSGAEPGECHEDSAVRAAGAVLRAYDRAVLDLSRDYMAETLRMLLSNLHGTPRESSS